MAPGAIVRAQAPGDVAAVRSVVEAAFGRVDEAELVAALEADLAAPVEVALVAALAGAPVGHVLLSRLDVGGHHGAALALAPLSVSPEHQGAGIGSALVRAALAAAGERPVIVLGDPAFYARFGFVPAIPLGLVPPEAWPADAWRVITPAGVGVPRGAVAYPRAFGAVA